MADDEIKTVWTLSPYAPPGAYNVLSTQQMVVVPEKDTPPPKTTANVSGSSGGQTIHGGRSTPSTPTKKAEPPEKETEPPEPEPLPSPTSEDVTKKMRSGEAETVTEARQIIAYERAGWDVSRKPDGTLEARWQPDIDVVQTERGERQPIPQSTLEQLHGWGEAPLTQKFLQRGQVTQTGRRFEHATKDLNIPFSGGSISELNVRGEAEAYFSEMGDAERAATRAGVSLFRPEGPQYLYYSLSGQEDKAKEKMYEAISSVGAAARARSEKKVGEPVTMWDRLRASPGEVLKGTTQSIGGRFGVAASFSYGAALGGGAGLGGVISPELSKAVSATYLTGRGLQTGTYMFMGKPEKAFETAALTAADIGGMKFGYTLGSRSKEVTETVSEIRKSKYTTKEGTRYTTEGGVVRKDKLEPYLKEQLQERRYYSKKELQNLLKDSKVVSEGPFGTIKRAKMGDYDIDLFVSKTLSGKEAGDVVEVLGVKQRAAAAFDGSNVLAEETIEYPVGSGSPEIKKWYIPEWQKGAGMGDDLLEQSGTKLFRFPLQKGSTVFRPQNIKPVVKEYYTEPQKFLPALKTWGKDVFGIGGAAAADDVATSTVQAALDSDDIVIGGMIQPPGPKGDTGVGGIDYIVKPPGLDIDKLTAPIDITYSIPAPQTTFTTALSGSMADIQSSMSKAFDTTRKAKADKVSPLDFERPDSVGLPKFEPSDISRRISDSIRGMASGQMRKSKSKSKTDTERVSKFDEKIEPFTINIPKFEPFLIRDIDEEFEPKIITTMNGDTPPPPTIVEFGFKYGGLPTLPVIPGGAGGKKPKKMGFGPFQPKKYTPSIVGLNVGKYLPKAPTKALTGFEIRPPVKKKKGTWSKFLPKF